MATLEAPSIRNLKHQINACEQAWLLAIAHEGNHQENELPKGLLGLLDWRLHGRVSRLLSRGEIPLHSCAIFINQGKLGKASLLLYKTNAHGKPTPLLETLKKLQVEEICLAESTFPEDFSKDLKHNLKREGIRWILLESTL